ncbi:hypothetical protein [Streptomyces sp. NPDC056337]|uniref:hypothetical protein n=1 Tax=Streptomyces sp. NPDC056337 TaxID=3345787 RepID=UPI0035DE4D0A
MVPAELTVLRPDRRQERRASDALRAFGHRHRVPLLATVPTIPLYAVWWVFLATGGGDLAAQQAWADFASRHGGSAYGLFWYGGMHSANYSVVSPYLMALLGVRTVTLVAGLAASWLTAVLIVRCGVRRPLGPALLASLALWCNVASGRTTFALGVAFAVAACVPLVRERRPCLAAGYAALATLASPVAGLFLAVVGAGYLMVRDWGRALVLLIPPAAVVGLTTLLFPFSGEQPMPADRIWPPVALGLAVTVLAPRTWRVVRWGGAVYAIGTVLTYLVASPVGTNVERFAELFAPAVLCAALLHDPPPPVTARLRRFARGLLAVALVFSVGWVGKKTADDLREYTVVPAWAAETDGVVRALEGLGADRTRVEVVPARDHREAARLAPHVNLARGWNRQLDVERARLFYDGSFSAATYRSWLDHWAVGFVVLPLGKPDGPARAEAALVRDPDLRPDWLEPVWQDPHWRVYRVRDAVPLVSAPGTVVSSTGVDLVLRVDRPGAVTVRVAWSPWLRSDGGCLARDGDFTRLTVEAPGEYRLSSRYGPSPGSADRC